MRRLWLAIALVLAGAGLGREARAEAQQGRLLDVPASSAWQHAETQMILPARAGGLGRGEIRDLGDDEMDVVAQYRGTDGTFATVYLFRTAVPDVALWFDRAATWIALRPEYGLNGGAVPEPTPFARPRAGTASGLRASIDLSGIELQSTAVAVAPLGDYLLKIRMSSNRPDRAALDARLTQFIEDLRWPAARPGERPATPIAACSEPLRLRNARLVRSDIGNALIDAVLGSTLAGVGDEERPPPVYCREPGATLAYGVYRPDASRQAYLIALNDAGIALSLGEAIDIGELSGAGRSRRRISMTLLGRNSTSVLPSFDRLPPPAQAMAVAFGNRGPVLSVSNTERSN